MKTNPSPLARRRGFALVVTLSLMILLTVVAVGLLSLSSVSLRASTTESAQQVARQNARLALTIAIGELQTHLGPDTRISARAETMAKHPQVSGSVSPNSPQAWWVGVSHSDPDQDLTGSDPQPVRWLVSGLSGNSAAAQLSGSFDEPVILIGKGSIDLSDTEEQPSPTGGEPIDAGKVPVTNASGNVSGAYAYFVDDEGMKAQLVASNREVRNDSTDGPRNGPFGGGILPGTFPIGILDGMSGLGDGYTEDLHKLISTNNLPLAGVSQPVAKSKFFSFTITSQGVLADVKNGGLKKDLTAAFDQAGPNSPNNVVFNRAFPSTGVNRDRYLVVDPKRLSEAPELRNGYIHFAIFRDFYQLKNHLKMVNTGSGSIPSLAPHLFEKGPLLTNPGSAFGKGTLGPHAIATNSPSQIGSAPYGNIQVSDTNSMHNPANYMHNPIFPVLSLLQQNAWVARNPSNPSQLRTHVQMFTGHYNPYNVGIDMLGNGAGTGPRIMRYPQVIFDINGQRQTGLHPKVQAHVRSSSEGRVLLEPGRSHVMGFRTNRSTGSEIDGQDGGYSQKIGGIVTESVFRVHPATAPAAAQNASVTVDFAFPQPSVMHGVDEDPGNKEVAQVHFAPFAWNMIPPWNHEGEEGDRPIGGNRPGKRVQKSIPLAQLNENSAISMGMFLRTTREKNSPLRPLMDANIRAVWNNPRWDSPLELPLLAAYSSDLDGDAPSRIVQVAPGSDQRGFSLLGNARTPSNGNDRVILFDVPRQDLVSIGQLQHANAGRFSYEPTYIVGNSYANLRIPLDNWRASVSDSYSANRGFPGDQRISGSFNLYDASYLANEVLFDSYTFTTIPRTNNNYRGQGDPIEPPLTAAYFSALLNGDQPLSNPRYIPYEPRGSTFTTGQLWHLGDAAGTSGAFFHNAGHLLVDGAFNVNSTSVDAWEAFLSGTHDLPVLRMNNNGAITGFVQADGVRFPRASSHVGDGMKSEVINENFWTGFRELNQQEVRLLATAIVGQIRERGPFLTLGEFVNRKLVDSELGKAGALQAALDLTVNADLDPQFASEADPGAPRLSNISAGSSQGAGFPGQLLQGDILQALSPYMQVRSDTFTIRAYGEARNPITGRIEARAWCEATVQRMPDAFPNSDPNASNTPLQDLINPSSRFGREFRAISFRWLHPDEV